MSTSIDQRVVQMKFDNANFEKNVSTSMSTLQKFKESLNFSGAVKGLDNVSKAAAKFSLGGLTGAAETVEMKFSAMSVASIAAISRIVDSAITAGENIARSLTIDPIRQGYGEYELKMGSVQTILAGTGASLEEVNAYLAELNDYADQTIYSFSDMTNSIGKFTNAGVDLEKAVKAIQGISNEAALSGANAQQASHAMYNFAQALSSGAVKLIDWKSIENANMATVEFKNELIKTGLELGTLVDVGGEYITTTTNLNGEVSDAFTATHAFNDSLAHQWITTDVLIETLGRYADKSEDLGQRAFAAAQDVKTFTDMMDALKEAVGSGWATSFELVIGDFEEAKKMWTAVNNVISPIFDAQADARNAILQEWRDMGGRETLFEGIANIWQGIYDSVSLVKEAFHELFPELTGEKLFDWTEKFRDATEIFKGLSETVETVTTSVSSDISEMGALVNEVWAGLWGNGQERVELLTEAGYDYYEVQNEVNKGIVEANEITSKTIKTTKKWSSTAEKIRRTLRGLFSVLSIGKELIKQTYNGLKPILSLLPSVGKNILDITADFGDFLSGLEETIRTTRIVETAIFGFASAVERIARSISSKLKAISGAVNDVTESFSNKFEELTNGNSPLTRISDILTVARDRISAFFEASNDAGKLNTELSSIGESLAGISFWLSDNILGIFEYLSSLSIGNPVQTFIDTFNELAGDNSPFTRIAVALDAIWDKIKGIFGENETLEETKPKLEEIAEELATISYWLVDHIATGLERIAGIKITSPFAPLEKIFQKIKGWFTWIQERLKERSFVADMRKLVDSVKGLFTGLKTGETEQATGNFIESLKKVGSTIWALVKTISPAKVLIFGFGAGIVSMLFNISGAFAKAKGAFGSMDDLFTGLAKRAKPSPIKTLAISIGILAASLVALSLVKPENLKGAITCLGLLAVGLLAFTAIVTVVTKKFLTTASIKRFANFSKGILMIAGAIAILAAGLSILSDMNVENIDTKFGILFLLIATFVGASVLLAKFAPKLSANAIFLLAFALAIATIARSLNLLSKVNTEEIEGKLSSLAAVVAILATLSLAAGHVRLGSSTGLFLLVASLLLMGVALEKLGDFKFDYILSTLPNFLVLIVLLAALGLAAKLAAPKLIQGSASILLMSAALLVLVGAIAILGHMDPGAVSNGTGAVAALLAMFAILLAASYLSSGAALKAGAGIAIMSASILLLAGAIAVIGLLNLGAVIKGTLAVVALMAMFGYLMKMTSLSRDAMGTVVALTAAIAVLTAAMILLTLVPFTEAFGAAFVLSGVLLAFAGSTKLLKTIGFKELLPEIALMILLIGGLIAAFIAMKELGTWNVLADAVALGASMLAFAGATKLLKAMQIKQALAEALLLVAMVGLLTLAFVMMNDLDPVSIIASAVALSAAMLAIAGAMKILGTINSAQIGGILKTVGAMLLMMGAMALFVPVLMILGSMKLEEIGKALLALFGTLAIFGAAAYLLGPVIPALIGLAQGLIQIGIASLLVGGGLFLLSLALAELAESGPAAFAVIADAVKKLVSSLAEGFQNVLARVKEWASSLIGSAKETLSNFVNAIVSFFGNVINRVKEWGSSMAEAGKQLITGFVEGIASGISSIVEGAANIGSSFVGKIVDFFRIGSPSKLMEELGGFVTEGFAGGISGKIDSVKDAAGGLGSGVLDSLSGSLGSSFGKEGENNASSFLEGFSDGSKNFNLDELTNISEIKFDDMSGLFGKEGENGALAFLDGFEDGIGTFNLDQLAGVSGQELGDLSAVFQDGGMDSITGFTDSLSGGSGNVEQVMDDLGVSSVGTLNGYKTDFVRSGENLINGFIIGVKNKQSTVNSAAAEIGRSFLNGLQSQLEIHSPSRITEEMGEYTVMGFSKGILASMGLVSDAISTMGQEVTDGMALAVQEVQDALDSDAGFSPVVSPVLDLTAVRNGAGSIGGLLRPSESFKMASMGSQTINAALEESHLATDNSDVVVALKTLHEDFAGLSGDNGRLLAYLDHYLPEMTNLQVVMDSGALVGQVQSGLDSRLGSGILRKRRQ